MNDSQTEQSPTSRGGMWLIALTLAVAAIVAVFVEPTGVLRGRLFGEVFFDGRPASYWEQALEADPAQRSSARKTLQNGGQQSAAVLTELLRSSESAEVRWTAAEILGDLGADAHHAADSLLAALTDPDPYVQSVAAEALPVVGAPAERAVPALASLLDGEHAAVAARALSVYKAQAAQAIPQLVAVLTDTSRTTDARWNAARTIGKIGPPAVETLPVLIEMTRDEESTVRGNAAEAIGDIGPTAAGGIPALVDVLDDPAPRVRHHAVRSLAYIGTAARGAVPDIQQLTKDPDDSVRQAAEEALIAVAPGQTPTTPADEQAPVRLNAPE